MLLLLAASMLRALARACFAYFAWLWLVVPLGAPEIGPVRAYVLAYAAGIAGAASNRMNEVSDKPWVREIAMSFALAMCVPIIFAMSYFI